MASTFIYLLPDSDNGGKKLRAFSRTVGADTVYEHAFVMCDVTDDRQARILAAAPAAGDAGLVVRPIQPFVAAEAAALPGAFAVVAGDDGVDTHPLQLTAGGDLKVSLDGETVPATQSGAWSVSLAAGAAAIGTVGVTSLPELPAGANVIGGVGVVGSVAVTGTFWQATQPVSLAALPALVAGTAYVGKVRQTDGTSDLTLRPLPTDGAGVVAMPVHVNSNRCATYNAVANNIVSGVITAGTDKQAISIEHAAISTKTVRIRKITIGGWQTTTLIGAVYARVYSGTAASSAGSAITPAPTNRAKAACEAVVKTLPTIVAATLLISRTIGSLLAATAQTSFPAYILYNDEPGSDQEPLVLRAGFLEGLVVSINSSVAHNLTLQITIEFTEE